MYEFLITRGKTKTWLNEFSFKKQLTLGLQKPVCLLSISIFFIIWLQSVDNIRVKVKA